MKRAAIIVFWALAALLLWSCHSNEPKYYQIPEQHAIEEVNPDGVLSEKEVMTIVEAGVPQGKQYIITKVGEDAFLLEEVASFPKPSPTSF